MAAHIWLHRFCRLLRLRSATGQDYTVGERSRITVSVIARNEVTKQSSFRNSLFHGKSLSGEKCRFLRYKNRQLMYTNPILEAFAHMLKTTAVYTHLSSFVARRNLAGSPAQSQNFSINQMRTAIASPLARDDASLFRAGPKDKLSEESF